MKAPWIKAIDGIKFQRMNIENNLKQGGNCQYEQYDVREIAFLDHCPKNNTSD